MSLPIIDFQAASVNYFLTARGYVTSRIKNLLNPLNKILTLKQTPVIF